MKKDNKIRTNKRTKMMMTLVLIAIFAFALCGCKKDATKGERPDVIIDDEATTPAPTKAPVEEATPEPTEVPVEEATPEPTEEPVVYEGIDMDSTLNGQDWLETFIGVIDEPKVVVFSDITGKKVIVEQDAEVTFNPDEDAMALFFPEGYTNGNVSSGIATSDKQVISTKNYEIFYLDAEKMREVEKSKAGFWVMKGEEKIVLIVHLIIE